MSRLVQSGVGSTLRYTPQPTIYCPVCKTDYPQSQTSSHILRHTSRPGEVLVARKEDHDYSTQLSKRSFMYPLVEALEFECNELALPQRRTILKFERQEKNKRQPREIQLKDQAVQTDNRPVLQYYTAQTDAYNCLDAVFNGGGFRSQDLLENNRVLASKRHLNSWEVSQIRK